MNSCSCQDPYLRGKTLKTIKIKVFDTAFILIFFTKTKGFTLLCQSNSPTKTFTKIKIQLWISIQQRANARVACLSQLITADKVTLAHSRQITGFPRKPYRQLSHTSHRL